MSDELDKREILKLRSEEVQEIIGNPPHWLIRWGIAIFIGILFLFLALSWFIRYPDIVSADFTLTSVNAPKPVNARTGGKLTQLMVTDNTVVKSGQILGFIESTADPDQVLKLSEVIDTLSRELTNNEVERISTFSPHQYNHLGELQANFQTFNQAILEFKAYLASGYYLRKKRILQHDLTYLQQLHHNLEEQKAMAEQDLRLARDNFAVQATLAVKKMIAPVAFKQAQSQLLAKKQPLAQLSASIINNESAQNDKKDQLLELDKEISQQKITFLQALNTFESSIESWEYQYVLKAPVSGTVSFISFLQKNQTVQAGQPLFYVKPENTKYIGLMYIPQFNMGKIRAGEKVNIKFSGYPFQEYGSVTGRIAAISSVPKDSKYLAKITLPDGLKTNYGRVLTYRDGMSATGDIVTANRRLIEKFIYRIRRSVNSR